MLCQPPLALPHCGTPACRPLPWEKAGQTNGTQGGTCFKGKILHSGHFARGKCFPIEMKWHCHSNQGATEVQPGHVQGVLRTAGAHGLSRDEMKGCEGTSVTGGDL